MTKTNHELARKAAIKVLDVFDLDEIEQIIRATYAEAFSRWIPCSERMPQWGEPTLFYDGKRTHCGWRSAITGAWHSATAETAFHETAVTHWQPLPQPPEVTK